MTALGSNTEQVRAHNRRVVLQAMRRHGPTSRAELTRLTALTAQSISNIVGDLIAEGLVVARGRKRGARGQPPMALALNPAGAFTIGAEVRPDGIVAVLADLMGHIADEARAPLAAANPSAVTPALKGLAEHFFAMRPGLDTALIGIGVVMPGPFGLAAANGERATELPGWAGLRPAEVLGAAFRQPVRVENDASAAAIAEHLHGAGRTLSSFACLYFGRGLGLGLVLDGRLYGGATGNAGEIGHVVSEPGGRPCFCGQRGCLERYVSLDALVQDLAPSLALDDADPLAGLDDVRLSRWLDGAAARLRPAVLMIEALFDTEAVIVGGVSDRLVDGIAARLADLPVPVAPRPGRRVLRGDTGPGTAARGAAALPLFDLTSPGHPAGHGFGRMALARRMAAASC